MRKGGKLHEAELEKKIKKMRDEGFKVVNLQGLSPDAIAVKDGKIIAVEVLGLHWRNKKGWHGGWTHTAKKRTYSMFDEVIISTFHYPPSHKLVANSDETLIAIKEMLMKETPLRTVEVLNKLPPHITRRQVNHILESLRQSGQINKETVSKGRYGRFTLWTLK